MSLYRRVELADGHVKYDPVDDEIERLRALIREIIERAGPECDYPKTLLYMAIQDAADHITQQSPAGEMK